jgi:bacillithiol biosynthesis cysteine-adding enzyme BshC
VSDATPHPPVGAGPRPFAARWGEGEPALQALLPRPGRDDAAWRRAVSALHPVVAGTLLAQNEGLACAPPDLAALLATPGVAFVVTGQQLGLWGGPLLALHKAAGAIALARDLSALRGTPVLPVFWLQAEDHDLAEVSEAHWLCPRGVLRTSGLPVDPGFGASLAHHRVPATMVDLLEEPAGRLQETPFGSEVAALLKRAWSPGRPWVEAFVETLAEVFAGQGLLVLQPRVPALAQRAMALHRAALDAHDAWHAALAGRAEAMAGLDVVPQVALRPDHALPFFHPWGPTGPRQRPERVAGAWTWRDRSGEARPLADSPCADDPMCWSSSALLRPVVQDALLPTLALLGGPAELSYLAQMQPLYVLAGVTPALVRPRPSACWVPGALVPLLAHRGMTATHWARRGAPPPRAEDAPWIAQLGADLDADLEESFSRHQAAMSALGQGADRVARDTRTHLARGVDALQRRLLRLHHLQQEDRRREDRLLDAWLHPLGGPQERSLCLWPVAARLGIEAMGRHLLDAVDPWRTDPVEIPC